MIIACPECDTRYAVPDEAIGLEGRTVRCAKCKHNWFQDGPEAKVVAPEPAPAPEPEPAPPVAEPEPAPEPTPEPEAEPEAEAEPAEEPAEEPMDDAADTSDADEATEPSDDDADSEEEEPETASEIDRDNPETSLDEPGSYEIDESPAPETDEPSQTTDEEPEPALAAPSVSHWCSDDVPEEELSNEPGINPVTGEPLSNSFDGADEGEPLPPPNITEDVPEEAEAAVPDVSYSDTFAEAPEPPVSETSDFVQSEFDRSPSLNDDAGSSDDVSQFEYEPPFRPRRNPLKLWTAAASIFAIVALATVAAVSYYGVPSWLPIQQPTWAVAQPELELDFPPDQLDRRTLPNGTEYFGVSGTVTNTGRETASVPSILIVLSDERDKPVFDWEIVPPKTQLAPGETITITEAMTDVPRSAKFAEIGWKPS